MIEPGISNLFGDLDVDATPDAHVGAMTWYGIGGRADVLVSPKSIDDLLALFRRCRQTETPIRILGAGANLLVSDEGVDGVVVKLDAPALRQTTFSPDGNKTLLLAMAGADMAKTLMDAARRGLDGLTQMAGIPASVGGAIRMNAGGAFGTISDQLQRVDCLTNKGELRTYDRSEIDFGYRSCNIKDPIILAATFCLQAADPIEVRKRVKEIFAFKKSTQPLSDHSAGCTFKNPPSDRSGNYGTAGQLIDEAGLKGARIGGALISTQHANFIITKPEATATDVEKLLELVQSTVAEKFGIVLEREIKVWHRDGGAAQ
ncbi:MAG: UDP-N-acetylmuramate dehydrogenase [Phycisphaerales bacterium]|nr:UDP-N-acetylmuramate dehydrogenase [Phycisphaerales bacterium]